MLHSILVGLDGSTDSGAAVRLGIAWAKRSGALLVGLGIIDEPTIARAAPVLLGGSPYADPIAYRERMADARRQVEHFLEQFSLRCAEAGVASKVLEDVGLPSEQILHEAQRYDLIMLGRRTRFHFEIQDRVDETLPRVIRDGPCPVVAVPENADIGTSTVIAFDGSLQAARALHAFAATGLGKTEPVHVVSVSTDPSAASRQAERAIDYLRFHGIKAEAHHIASIEPPARAILSRLHDWGAGLLVLGAYGEPVLKEFFLGSVTRTFLKESSVPLFLFH